MITQITAMKRLSNSINGNPRYRLTLTNGAQFNTATDSAAGYDVQNYQPGKPVDITLNGRGTISSIRPV